MKISVEYSESIQVSEGCWRKIGVSFESDTETDSLHPSGTVSSSGEITQHLHNQAKDYVKKWHQEEYPMTTKSMLEPIVAQATPVINREAERVQILIENAST